MNLPEAQIASAYDESALLARAAWFRCRQCRYWQAVSAEAMRGSCNNILQALAAPKESRAPFGGYWNCCHFRPTR